MINTLVSIRISPDIPVLQHPISSYVYSVNIPALQYKTSLFGYYLCTRITITTSHILYRV